ncbi:MAG: hypothetical protein J6K14_02140 [Clostridia bacterium]|nr:hypothetical protein [Clostridia bacterium]
MKKTSFFLGILAKRNEWIFEQKFVILSAQGVVTYVKPRERGFMPKITVYPK